MYLYVINYKLPEDVIKLYYENGKDKMYLKIEFQRALGWRITEVEKEWAGEAAEYDVRMGIAVVVQNAQWILDLLVSVEVRIPQHMKNMLYNMRVSLKEEVEEIKITKKVKIDISDW